MGKIMLRAALQKVGFSHENKYITRAVRYSTINADDLAEHASVDSGISKAMLKAAFESMLIQAEELLLNGHNIVLGNLGTLQFTINCTAVDTKEEVTAENVTRRKILFKPSMTLKRKIAAVGFETEIVSDGK